MRAFWMCCFVLCTGLVRAEDTVKMSCRFLCLDNDSPPSMIAVAEKEPDVPCNIPTGSISKAVTCYADASKIAFATASDRKPAATATIPANIRSVILIFVAGPKTPNALAWRVFVIEDSTKNFPDGGAFVANFHNQDIRFIIGESKIVLHSAGSHGVARPEKRDAFNMAPVAFQFQQGETWRDASESLLRFLPGMRYLIFSYLDAASGRPRISTFQDTEINEPVAATP